METRILRAAAVQALDSTAVAMMATTVVHASTTTCVGAQTQAQTRTHQSVAGARILVVAAVTVGEYAVKCSKGGESQYDSTISLIQVFSYDCLQC